MVTTASPYSWSASAASALHRQLDRASERWEVVRPKATLGLLDWTAAHRRIGDEPLDPRLVPWLAELYACTDPEVWVMKASQVFISEWMTSTALWCADTGHAKRGNALYVFPTQSQMDDFAQARVGKAIEDSAYIASRVGRANVDGVRGAARVRLKRLGDGHIYFRGADNRRQIISVDADVLLLDEVDEFKSGVVDVARKRLSSSINPLIRGGSTPKFPASGIAPLWQKTTRERYQYRCGACGLEQPFVFPQDSTAPRSLRPDGALVCVKCGGPMSNRATGRWVADAESAVRGFHVNRLYSPRTDLVALARLAYDILEGRVSDQSAIQEFWNQDIGEPFAPEGGSLSDDVIGACERDYTLPAAITAAPVVMGIDVGAVLHVYIKCRDTDDPDATRLLLATTTQDWGELDRLMAQFKVGRAVIDGMPEDGKSMAFCQRHAGRAFACFYPNMVGWQHRESAVWKLEQRTVAAHRTRSLDALMARFYQQLEHLPRGSALIPGLRDQLKAPVRVVGSDANGRPVARYDEGSAADHFAHAANYAQIAWEYARGTIPLAPQRFGINVAPVPTQTTEEARLAATRRNIDAWGKRGQR